MELLSKKATCNSHGQDSSYFLGWEEYEKNPYDELRNPTGIIQMGLAENQLSFDLLESWLASNSDPAGFMRDGQSIFRELALFQDYHGLPAFKNALVDFMAEIRGNRVSFDPKKLVLAAGATSANETLVFCLAEPGDTFLLPTPYYPGFDRDFKWRTGIEIVPIVCTGKNSFRITETALEDAYKAARKRKLRVKGVLVSNPSNPLGTTLTEPELNLLLSFIAAKNIHLISDETYSGTVFSPPDFISIMEVLVQKNYSTEVWNRVHIVYSLSTDLGLPGLHVGAIYSNDDMVVAAATNMLSFGLVSSRTQQLLASMILDKEFTKNYILEYQTRLKYRQEMLVKGLQSAGISCLKSNAGLFCWVDMRHLLGSKTFDSEMDLRKKIVYQVGLNISPGSSFHCSEPGWFRVCFANTSEETLGLAIQRIKSLVESTMNNDSGRTHNNSRRSRSFAKWGFRLCMLALELFDFFASID